MNIFATAIFTSNHEMKNLIIERLDLIEKNIDGQSFYIWKNEDQNFVLWYIQDNNYKNAVEILKNHFDILKVFHVGTCMALWDVDLESWDVLLPNTIINNQNEAIFLESVIDKNYDLKKFGLLLNGICFTLPTPITSPDELEQFQEEYLGDILDYEAFFFAKQMNDLDLSEKSIVIKINSQSEIELVNAVDILELML